MGCTSDGRRSFLEPIAAEETKNGSSTSSSHPTAWVRDLTFAKDCHSKNILISPSYRRRRAEEDEIVGAQQTDNNSRMSSSGTPRAAVRTLIKVTGCGQTCSDLAAGTPILAWFSDEMCSLIGMPFLGLTHIRGKGVYSCDRCDKTFKDPNPLKIHMLLDCDRTPAEVFWRRLLRVSPGSVEVDERQGSPRSSDVGYEVPNGRTQQFTPPSPPAASASPILAAAILAATAAGRDGHQRSMDLTTRRTLHDVGGHGAAILPSRNGSGSNATTTSTTSPSSSPTDAPPQRHRHSDPGPPRRRTSGCGNDGPPSPPTGGGVRNGQSSFRHGLGATPTHGGQKQLTQFFKPLMRSSSALALAATAGSGTKAQDHDASPRGPTDLVRDTSVTRSGITASSSAKTETKMADPMMAATAVSLAQLTTATGFGHFSTDTSAGVRGFGSSVISQQMRANQSMISFPPGDVDVPTADAGSMLNIGQQYCRLPSAAAAFLPSLPFSQALLGLRFPGLYHPSMSHQAAAAAAAAAMLQHQSLSLQCPPQVVSRAPVSSPPEASTSATTPVTPTPSVSSPETQMSNADIETMVSNMGRGKGGHLCIYCGKVYSRKYGLKIHIRTHTGYKPLRCKVCLRPFGDPSNLNKHIRLHAQGETPYRCDLCGKILVRRRDLERHILSRHPDQAAASSSQLTSTPAARSSNPPPSPSSSAPADGRTSDEDGKNGGSPPRHAEPDTSCASTPNNDDGDAGTKLTTGDRQRQHEQRRISNDDDDGGGDGGRRQGMSPCSSDDLVPTSSTTSFFAAGRGKLPTSSKTECGSGDSGDDDDEDVDVDTPEPPSSKKFRPS